MKDRKSDKGSEIVKAFNLAAATDVFKKEVAALMGDVNEDNPDVLPGGQRSIYGFTEAKVSQSQKKKDHALIDLILRESIRRALTKINEIIEYFRERMEELLEYLEKSQELLGELNEQFQILETELTYFQETGLFDLDESGKLKNAKAEEILSSWEKRNGKIIDRSFPESYEVILKILMSIEQQKDEITQNIRNSSAEYDYFKIKLDEALEIKNGLLSDDPMRCRSALLKAQGLLENYNADFDLQSEAASNPSSGEEVFLNDIEAVEAYSDTNSGDFSFGFSPLKDRVSEATTPKNQQPENNVSKKSNKDFGQVKPGN